MWMEEGLASKFVLQLYSVRVEAPASASARHINYFMNLRCESHH